jgi:hypothetical protein
MADSVMLTKDGNIKLHDNGDGTYALVVYGGTGGGGVSVYQYQAGDTISDSYGDSLVYASGDTFLQVSTTQGLPVQVIGGSRGSVPHLSSSGTPHQLSHQ